MASSLKKNVGEPGYSDAYFPTVKAFADKIRSGLASERPRLRSLDAEHPGWHEMEQAPREPATVPVSKVVGSAFRHMDFYEDWSDAKTDNRVREEERWGRLLKAVEGGKRPDEVGGPGQRIHLLKFGDEYWVGDDGNRRVALAKRMGLKEIRCEVSEVRAGR
jgi:hypothetical protein